MKKDYFETRLFLDSDDKDSANRTQSSLLVIAEVQPVLVFEDKDMRFFSSFQEIIQILPQLLATTIPKSDKRPKSPELLSQNNNPRLIVETGITVINRCMQQLRPRR